MARRMNAGRKVANEYVGIEEDEYLADTSDDLYRASQRLMDAVRHGGNVSNELANIETLAADIGWRLPNSTLGEIGRVQSQMDAISQAIQQIDSAMEVIVSATRRANDDIQSHVLYQQSPRSV